MLLLTLLSLSFHKPSITNGNGNTGCMMEYDSVIKKRLYVWSDKMPSPRDGKSVGEHFQYDFRPPRQAANESAQFSLHLVYVVDTKGEIKETYVLGKNVSEYSTKDKAVLAFIRSLSPMKPGYCNGKKVPFRMVFSVHWRESE